MSKNSLQDFLRFIAQDAVVSSKVRELKGDINAIVNLARENGYDFTARELEEYQNKVFGILKDKAKKKLNQPTDTSQKGADNIARLIKLAETDNAVAVKLSELNFDEPEAFIGFGRELGFVFTADDVKIFAHGIMEQSDELSDEELETAAGGAVTFALVAVGVLGAFIVGAAVGATVGGAIAVVTAVMSGKK